MTTPAQAMVADIAITEEVLDSFLSNHRDAPYADYTVCEDLAPQGYSTQLYRSVQDFGDSRYAERFPTREEAIAAGHFYARMHQWLPRLIRELREARGQAAACAQARAVVCAAREFVAADEDRGENSDVRWSMALERLRTEVRGT